MPADARPRPEWSHTPGPDGPPANRSPEAFRREYEREVVHLLRQNRDAQQEILDVLRQILVVLLRSSREEVLAGQDCADTGIWSSPV
jgi:hypothetical protein